MIIQKNDWSSIKWTDLLGIETIKALSLDGTIVGQYDVLNNERSSIIDLSCIGNSECGDQNGIVFDHYYNSSNQADYMVFSFTSFFKHWDSSANPTQKTYDNEINDIHIQFRIYYYDNERGQFYYDTCELQNNLIVCNIQPNRSYRALWVNVILPNSQPNPESYNDYYIQLYGKATLIKSSGQAIIDNQNQNTNQTISTITDSNTTEASSEANNFFSGFTSQDNGGISSIITAPLQAISGLVSAQCIQIELPIPYLDNKTLILPCMSSIYREHFGAVFSLYQTIIFGAIAYRMLVSLFMMIQGFKNPDDDKIEVVDL